MHVRNRLSTKATNQAPHALWFNKKPNIQHLKVFGYTAFSHVPDQLRSKLDDKAEHIVFVGYSSRSKGYRLYDHNSGLVVTRHDVIFDEV